MKRARTAAGILLTLALIIAGSYLAARIMLPEQIHDVKGEIEAFYDQERDSLEVMAFGSSHVWKSFDPKVITEEFGLNCWTYASNWQHFNTTLFFIRDALRRQSPKYILVETFRVNDCLSDAPVNAELLGSFWIPYSEAKGDYLREALGAHFSRYVDYLFPLSVVHSNWNEINEWGFHDHKSREDFLKSGGYWAYSDSNRARISKASSFTEEPLSERALSILDEILSLCREKGCTPIFYTAPYEGEFSYGKALEDYAKSRGAVYINFFKKKILKASGIDGKTDFIDPTHLNDRGAKKIARYLGKEIEKLEAAKG